MEIRLRRSGGLGGGEQPAVELDTQRLPEPARADLEQRVRDADFFALPPELAGGIGADIPRWELTVRGEGREHTVAWNEEGGVETAQVRDLAERVAVLA